MGEIADMLLDGTMDSETGEWNFDGEDGPGFPMTGAEAAEFRDGPARKELTETQRAARRARKTRQKARRRARLKLQQGGAS